MISTIKLYASVTLELVLIAGATFTILLCLVAIGG